jgi:ribosomal subunit interface protein
VNEKRRRIMPFRVSGKNIDIGGALRERVSARVVEALSKYFDGGYSGHVTVEKEGFGFRTQCAIHLDSGITLHTEANAADAYASADQAALRIEKRLRRYKRRLRDSPGTEAGRSDGWPRLAYAVLEAPSDEDLTEDEAYHPAVIAETTKPLHRLAVSDAVLELDMTGAPALVFLHAGTGRVNVVYRRHDGAIGWIDPPPSQP